MAVGAKTRVISTKNSSIAPQGLTGNLQKSVVEMLQPFISRENALARKLITRLETLCSKYDNGTLG